MLKSALIILASIFVFGCAHAEDVPHKLVAKARGHVELRPYDADRGAMADVDAAFARAQVKGTKLVVIMGANWCHDSRALATRIDMPEFTHLFADNYEIVYVSVGTKPGQNDQNRDVSERFGVDKIEGTPTVFIAKADGTVLNADSAGYWRRAESIPVDMTLAYFSHYAEK